MKEASETVAAARPWTMKAEMSYIVNEVVDLTVTEEAVKAGWTPERFEEAFQAGQFIVEDGDVRVSGSWFVVATYGIETNGDIGGETILELLEEETYPDDGSTIDGDSPVNLNQL